MAYDGTIPELGNLISNDIPAMQENFSLLESAQVVDEGSTADGYYIRYESGWQICTTWIQLDYATSTTLSDEWSFPVSFASGNDTIVNFIADEADRNLSTSRTNLTLQGLFSDNDYETSAQLKQWVTGGGLDTEDYIRAQVFAMGRWK